MTIPVDLSDDFLAYASLDICGVGLDPDFWTRYFGVEPNRAVVKGQRFRTSSGKLSRAPGRTGLWSYSSKHHVHSDDLNPHIAHLVARLALPRPDLPALLRTKQAEMVVFCYWDNESGDRIATINSSIKTIIEECGGVIKIDEYDHENPGGSIFTI